MIFIPTKSAKWLYLSEKWSDGIECDSDKKRVFNDFVGIFQNCGKSGYDKSWEIVMLIG